MPLSGRPVYVRFVTRVVFTLYTWQCSDPAERPAGLLLQGMVGVYHPAVIVALVALLAASPHQQLLLRAAHAADGAAPPSRPPRPPQHAVGTRETTSLLLPDVPPLGDVAIVNSRRWHLEVVAGAVHVLAPLARRLTVLLHPDSLEGGRHAMGLVRWLRQDYPTGGWGGKGTKQGQHDTSLV